MSHRGARVRCEACLATLGVIERGRFLRLAPSVTARYAEGELVVVCGCGAERRLRDLLLHVGAGERVW